MSRERDVVYVNQASGEAKPEDTQVVAQVEVDEAGMSAEEREGRARIAEFMALPESERKARRADILDRGVMFDRLTVDLPADLHGEWARNDPMSVENMRSLGFWVDETYATKRALHSEGGNANIVGDAIHMVTTKENKKLIDSVQQTRILREQRDPRKSREESTVGLPSELPAFSESKVHEVTASDLRDAVTRSDQQTKIQR